MPREKELYRDTLERIRKRADALYPNTLLYTQLQAAQIMGCGVKKIRSAGLKDNITTEQLARIFA